MNEFNNRVEVQRLILRLVNQYVWEKEELFGLSSKAIERWVSANRVRPESSLVPIPVTASSKLFFLANKSQEQISPEYQASSAVTSALSPEMLWDRQTLAKKLQ